MPDTNYLQLAKLHLSASCDGSYDYEDRIQDAVQAQAAALIVIAEQLDYLILEIRKFRGVIAGSLQGEKSTVGKTTRFQNRLVSSERFDPR